MKTTIFLLLCFVSIQKANALDITQVSVSTISEDMLHVSINTEAVELYYFDSWQYSVSGNTIIIEALFIPGFGSQIAWLNNNFDVPINTDQAGIYHLVIKVYYTFYKADHLQDMCEASFSVPFSGSIVVSDTTLSNDFVNAVDGKLIIGLKISAVWIFDLSGKITNTFQNKHGKIDTSSIDDGLYIIVYLINSAYKTTKIVLRQ